MKKESSLNIVHRFKGSNLKVKLNELKSTIIKDQNFPNLIEIYQAALEVKKQSAQIDEIVHAVGIIQCLPNILKKGERVVDLSLASGADGEGIDLVTSHRIAEFKFARWQEGKGNGTRKRQVFSDLVTLYMHPTEKSKELYVYGSPKVIEFFSSRRSKWKNQLSKSGGLDLKLAEYLRKSNNDGIFLHDVYKVSNVQIYDLDKILQ